MRTQAAKKAKEIFNWVNDPNCSKEYRVVKIAVTFSLMFNFISALVDIISGDLSKGIKGIVATIMVNVLFMILVRGYEFARKR